MTTRAEACTRVERKRGLSLIIYQPDIFVLLYSSMTKSGGCSHDKHDKLVQMELSQSESRISTRVKVQYGKVLYLTYSMDVL